MVRNLPSAVKYRRFLLGRGVNNDVGRRRRRSNMDVDCSEEDLGEVIDSYAVSLEEEEKEDEDICSESNHSETSSDVNHRAYLLNKDKKSADKKLKFRGVRIEEVREESTSCSNLEKGKAVIDRTRQLVGSSSELEKKPSDRFGGRSNSKSLMGSCHSTSCVDVICISDDDD